LNTAAHGPSAVIEIAGRVDRDAFTHGPSGASVWCGATKIVTLPSFQAAARECLASPDAARL